MTMITNSRVWRRWDCFYRKHTALVAAATNGVIVLVAVLSIGAGFIAFTTRSRDAHLAVVSCHRSQEFGPSLVKFYTRYHALTPHQLKQYRGTIPKHC